MTQYYKDHLYLSEIHLEVKKAKFLSLKFTNVEKKVDSKDILKNKLYEVSFMTKLQVKCITMLGLSLSLGSNQ
jgi:hypothetical protein